MESNPIKTEDLSPLMKELREELKKNDIPYAVDDSETPDMHYERTLILPFFIYNYPDPYFRISVIYGYVKPPEHDAIVYHNNTYYANMHYTTYGAPYKLECWDRYNESDPKPRTVDEIIELAKRYKWINH